MKYPILIQEGIFQWEMGQIEIDENITDPIDGAEAIVRGLRSLANELELELVVSPTIEENK